MKIIIVGAYAIGTHLARLLSRNNEDITLIDEDEERLAQIGNDCDLLTMNASPSSINTLMDAGVAHTSLFIAVTPSQSLNLNTCIIAHALGAKKTVAKINDAEFIAAEKKEFFRKLGVDELIYPEVLAARDIINGLKMSWVRQRWDVHDGALVMLGIKLREACEILDKPLKEISGPNDPYHVVAIKRDTDTIIPGGNDVLKLYDLVYFMTTKQYIPYIRKIVGKEHYVDVKNVMIMGGGTTAVRAIQTMPEYMDVKVLEARDIINGLKMSWVRQRWDVHDGALVMLGIKLREACEILDKPLKEISGPNDPYHVVAIKRDADTIIPGGNDVLKLYDLAYFMTTKQYIPYIRKIVGKEHYVDVKNVMIMGGGTTAVRAIQTMPEYMDVKVLENDINRCEELNDILENDKTLVINGDGRDIPLLYEEGIKNTQAFVALTGNAETNILACLTAKRMGVRKTVAVVENIDYVSMAESLDIGTIINKKAIAASRIYQMMLDADVMNVTFLMSANADVAEFIPKEGSKITQKPVKDLGLPQGMTIGGLVRNDQGMLVSGNTMIQAGDSVVVFCHGQNIKKIERLFT